MKLAELGIVALLVIFIGGMTYTHQENIKENKKKALLFEITKQEDLEKQDFLDLAFVETISHDSDSSSNTVHVTLDASSSFDGGNVADKLVKVVDVPDTKKPKCAEYECDSITGRNCDCIRYKMDECGNTIYDSMCAEYEKGCDYNKIERCKCIENMTMLVEYIDDCEYTILPHDKRVDYLKKKMKSEFKSDNVTYSWSVVQGDVELPKDKQTDAVLVLELSEGTYEFSCIITDPYGATDVAVQTVIIKDEPNNAPEANIMVRRSTPKEKESRK